MKAWHVDAALGALLALGFAIVAFVFRQESYWSDGRALAEMVDSGLWNYHNLLYLPVAHLAVALGAPFGLGTRAALEILSAGASGLALGLTFAAARAFGVGRAASACGALVLATAPTVWFYATCLEVHPLQLAASAGVLLVFALAARRGTLGASALPSALGFCVLQGTHVSGVLCVPALAFLALRGRGRWAWPRHVVSGILVVGAFAGTWWYLQYHLLSANAPALRFGALALHGLFVGWDPRFAWHELVLESGMLYPIAAVLLVLSWRRDRAAVLASLPFALVLLVATFLPFALSFHIEERGAYYLAALPALGVCAARLLDAMGSWRLPLAAGLVGIHLAWATAQVREWAEDYPGHEWAPTLEEEVGPGALVLTLYTSDWIAVENHTAMQAVRPPDATLLDPAQSAALMLKAVGGARSQGRTVVILRTLYEIDFPTFADAVRELVRRYGPPRPGRRSEYLVYDPPAAGTGGADRP